MEKEIKMSFKEYQEMVETIKKQKEALDKIKDGDGIILLDYRVGHRLNQFSCRVPKIEKGEVEVSRLLGQDLNNMYETIRELEFELNRHRNRVNQEKQSRSNFWRI